MTLLATVRPHSKNPLDTAMLKTRLRKMMQIANWKDGTPLQKANVSLLFTNDKEIRELNANYRQKDKPTDVLSFAMHEGEFSEVAGAELGDIVLSVETTLRQAKAHRKEPMAEATMLLAHGLLHLIGWDHQTDAQEKAMTRETKRLIAATIDAKAMSAAEKKRSAKPTRVSKTTTKESSKKFG
jgi:probable rRNA maturation factor